MALAHWKEIESHGVAKGDMDVVWQRLGATAGTKRVVIGRVEQFEYSDGEPIEDD